MDDVAKGFYENVHRCMTHDVIVIQSIAYAHKMCAYVFVFVLGHHEAGFFHDGYQSIGQRSVQGHGDNIKKSLNRRSCCCISLTDIFAYKKKYLCHVRSCGNDTICSLADILA